MREIIVDWDSPGSAGKVSVFHFGDIPSVASQRLALSDFLTDVATVITDVTSYAIRTEGREFDPETGTLTGTWTENTSYAASGGATSEPVADATQVLVRWQTNRIRNGRYVRGRTFIPGLGVDKLLGGNIASGTRTVIGNAATDLANAGVELQVWSRPQGSTLGVGSAVLAGSVWAEASVLRRRRG